MLAFKKILVATDFTETSDRALEYALELARALGGAVTVCHAYEIPVMGFPDGALIAGADVATRIADVSADALRKLQERYAGAGVELTTTLREGAVHEEILAAAEEADADLVVIGCHGRRGVARAILGSVAEHVIRTCTRPVLTIHATSERHPKRSAA